MANVVEGRSPPLISTFSVVMRRSPPLRQGKFFFSSFAFFGEKRVREKTPLTDAMAPLTVFCYIETTT